MADSTVLDTAQVTQALLAARALIANPEHWCQGVPKHGCRRCSLEAISAACGSNDELFRACHRRLSRAMGALMVSKFNDENDHATVLAAWDKAIAEGKKTMKEIADDRLTPEEADKLWRQLFPPIRNFLSPKFPTIVTLCGSTRFMDAFVKAQRDETLAGKIVLSVGLFGHQEGMDMGGEVKKQLDELHLRKIDLADEVLILNAGDYIGSSTRRELEYARSRGKKVRFLEPHFAE